MDEIVGTVIEFKVTRDDLDHTYYSSYNCPIARAIKRHLKMDDGIVVTRSEVYINGSPYPLDSGYDDKARWRAKSFWGKIVGGFTVKLIR